MSLDVGEVFEEFEAEGLAFFGVELGGEEVSSADHGGEGEDVFGFGGDPGFVGGGDVIAVDKVEVGLVGNVGEEGLVAIDLEGIPAHVGDFDARGFGEAEDFSGDDAESFVFAVFVADVEEHLETEADAEERFLGGDVVLDRGDEILAVEFADGVAEGSDAGEDDFFGGGDVGGRGGDAGVDLERFKGFLNAAEIAHAVVDDGDHCFTYTFKSEGGDFISILSGAARCSFFGASPPAIPGVWSLVGFREESIWEVEVVVGDVGDADDEDFHSSDGSVHDAGRDVDDRSLADGVFDAVEFDDSGAVEDVVEFGGAFVVVLFGAVDIDGMRPGGDI